MCAYWIRWPAIGRRATEVEPTSRAASDGEAPPFASLSHTAKADASGRYLSQEESF